MLIISDNHAVGIDFERKIFFDNTYEFAVRLSFENLIVSGITENPDWVFEILNHDKRSVPLNKPPAYLVD